jgi:hypothetical protein
MIADLVAVPQALVTHFSPAVVETIQRGNIA